MCVLALPAQVALLHLSPVSRPFLLGRVVSSYLPDFVRITAEHFRINEVSADMAYCSRKNLHAIADVGGTPFIPFKTGSVAVRKGKGRQHHDPLWEQMYHHFTLREADFNRHHHKRSNVETVFHMIKAKFGRSGQAPWGWAKAPWN